MRREKQRLHEMLRQAATGRPSLPTVERPGSSLLDGLRNVQRSTGRALDEANAPRPDLADWDTNDDEEWGL